MTEKLEEKMAELQKHIKYTFHEPKILEKALTR
jgi:dsRNA-specific ribonuclease